MCLIVSPYIPIKTIYSGIGLVGLVIPRKEMSIHLPYMSILVPLYIRRPRQTQGGVRKGKRVYDTAARKE